jgi:hypothetical protein
MQRMQWKEIGDARGESGAGGEERDSGVNGERDAALEGTQHIDTVRSVHFRVRAYAALPMSIVVYIAQPIGYGAQGRRKHLLAGKMDLGFVVRRRNQLFGGHACSRWRTGQNTPWAVWPRGHAGGRQ